MPETPTQLSVVARAGSFAPTKTSMHIRFAFDVLCAAAGLILLSPLLAAVAFAIRLNDGGSMCYSQFRMGKDFRPFRLLKFRSMVSGADRLSQLTARADPRVTRVGWVLRKYKLDELPQLLNVLRGEMQLVGPRPEVERYVEMFRPHYAVLLRDRPGITDPATLVYRNEENVLREARLEQQYISEVLPEKLLLSLEYQHRRNWASDVGILVRTVLGLFHTGLTTP